MLIAGFETIRYGVLCAGLCPNTDDVKRRCIRAGKLFYFYL